jgi:hypothetical protein
MTIKSLLFSMWFVASLPLWLFCLSLYLVWVLCMPLWQVTLIIFAVGGVVATPLIVVLAQREKEAEANLGKPATVIRNVDQSLNEYLELLQKNARKGMG